MQNNNNKNADIFEMILKSTGGDYVFDPTKLSKNKSSFAQASKSEKSIGNDWHEDHQEGQLAVDVINTDNNIIVLSTMAGASTSKIEVYVHNDLLTIKGERVMPEDEIGEGNFIHQECYWGRFSRTIVLPVDVKGDSAKAKYDNGILSVTIPKRKIDSKIKIKVVDG